MTRKRCRKSSNRSVEKQRFFDPQNPDTKSFDFVSQVSVSASYNLSFTFDLECTDEVDMQKKIETILQRGLENAGVPIEMTFGSDGVGLAEPNLEKSLDFQYEKVA